NVPFAQKPSSLTPKRGVFKRARVEASVCSACDASAPAGPCVQTTVTDEAHLILFAQTTAPRAVHCRHPGADGARTLGCKRTQRYLPGSVGVGERPGIWRLLCRGGMGIRGSEQYTVPRLDPGNRRLCRPARRRAVVCHSGGS